MQDTFDFVDFVVIEPVDQALYVNVGCGKFVGVLQQNNLGGNNAAGAFIFNG